MPAERAEGEHRVAVVPQVLGKFTQLGFEVVVESGAGRSAFADDDAYRSAGAQVIGTAELPAALGQAAVVASVRPLQADLAAQLGKGTVAVSFLSPAADAATIASVAKAGATALSFDLLPRISRAQSMDALTSQALVSGYRASLVAADRLPKFFPLFMIAARTR